MSYKFLKVNRLYDLDNIHGDNKQSIIFCAETNAMYKYSPTTNVWYSFTNNAELNIENKYDAMLI